jgi:molybdopterin synthase catalytic subunit
MKVFARMVDGPVVAGMLVQARETLGVPGSWHETGARVCFEGVVRRGETDPEQGRSRELEALDYEAYEPMAQQGLAELTRSVGARHGLHAILALHSRGRVGVGEVSFLLEVHAAHRAPAIAALSEFIDTLKRDLPIWKRPVWSGESVEQQLR